MRGALNKRVADVARVALGRDITLVELRLMPYIQYCAMNDQNIDPSRVNHDERQVLAKWRADKLIEGGAADLYVTRKFWDAMSTILWYGYVIHGGEEEDTKTD